MKKIIYVAIAVATTALMASCDPQVLKGGSPDAPVTDSQLASCFVVAGQFADEACTKPQADGNYIQYFTDPAVTIQVYTIKDGAESVLATGPRGVFKIYPKRKSPNQQSFFIKTLNQDGTVTRAEKSVNVFVPTELDPELKLLLGTGTKSWTWNTDFEGDGWFYGEGGNTGHGSDFTATDFGGAWWGAHDTGSLLSYAKCAGDGPVGDLHVDAYMTLDEDGNVITYSNEGVEVRKGSFELKNYAPERPNGWEIGQFLTSGPATLFPYCIHGTGIEETEFQLMYLDDNYMTLCDPESSSAGDWDNITYWSFKAKK